MVKKRKFHPQSNYVPKVLKASKGAKPGLHHMHVFHDNWCSFWETGLCNCNPEVVMTESAETPQRPI